jgi:hypothetical protein
LVGRAISTIVRYISTFVRYISRRFTTGGLTFSRKYCHVEAHQDDKVKWEELSLDAQLNAACNAGVKAMIRKQDITDLPQQEALPLEPICMFVEEKKGDIRHRATYPNCGRATGSMLVLPRDIMYIH